jgi:hypothetical protein
MVPELVRVMQDLQRAKLEHAVLIDAVEERNNLLGD